MTVGHNRLRATLPAAIRIAGIIALALVLLYLFKALDRDSREKWIKKSTLEQLLAEAKTAPDEEALNVAIAQRLDDQGQTERAYQVMKRMVQIHPKSPMCWQVFARTAADTSRVLEALDGYKRAVAIDANYAPVEVTVGTIYIRAGLYTDGAAEIDRARRLNPKAKVDTFLWATALYSKGRYAEAWDRVWEGLNVGPTEDQLYPILTDIALKVNKLDDAESMLLLRIKLSPMYAMPLVRGSLARLLLAKGDSKANLKDALYYAEAAARAENAASKLPLAQVRYAVHDVKGARKALDIALHIQPDQPDCLSFLADIEEKEGNPDRAKQIRETLPASHRPETEQCTKFRLAAAANPSDTKAQLQYAAALEDRKEFGKAAEVCIDLLAKLGPGAHADIEERLNQLRKEALNQLDADERAAKSMEQQKVSGASKQDATR